MILVTGSSGFVGRHLVDALTERLPSTSLRLLDTSAASSPLPAGVQFICAAVEDSKALKAGMRGVDAVVHLAAKVQPSSRELGEMWQVNVEGTRNVFSAAVDAGCELFVHLSSAGIYGHPVRPAPFKEDDVAKPSTPYQRSKWEAELVVRESDPKDTTLNVLRPAGIYGPGSYLEIPSYRRVLSRRAAIELRGGVVVHPTYVRDVVEGVVAILQQPAPHGTVFNLGGEKAIPLQDLDALVAEALHVRRRRFVLPSWLAGPLAVAADPLLTVAGRRNPIRVGISRGRLFSAAVDDRRFRQRYPDVPIIKLEDGLRAHIEWARAQGLL